MPKRDIMHRHSAWLEIVETDLNSAKVLLKSGLFSTALFHGQQAAEKALKAYLVLKKGSVYKTHDLVKLVVLCTQIDADFKHFTEIAITLNPFSTEHRYPSEHDIPDAHEVRKAIKQAQKIVVFVVKKMATPTTGIINIFDLDTEDQ